MARKARHPIIVLWLDELIQHQREDRFRALVQHRYSQGTLCRIIQSAPDSECRRAATLALGMIGRFDCNDILAETLYDPDPVVREWGEKALWHIWFHDGTQAQNDELQAVAQCLAQGKAKQAEERATNLIRQAPRFAEAYNQRAIARWKLGMPDEAIADCTQVLELNPNHFGAAAGMGQCYLQRGHTEQAIQCFQRALDINPNLDDVSQILQRLTQ